jgi:glycosyltransferase involved in cell wall biosynthesis
MKILFFCRRFYPLIGGVEKHVLLISKKLIELGHEVTVVTEWQTSEGKFKVYEEFEKINIYRIPISTTEKNKKFQIWLWLFKHLFLIKQADVIHCHDVFYWYLPFLFLFPAKKVFTTFHGYEGDLPPKTNKIFMHKLSGYLSDGSIAIGDFHQKWFKVRSEIVSYGAVEVNNSVNKIKNKYDFCFLGRLAADTGIMIYLEAFKKLKGNYSLIICGDGPQMKMAKEYVEKNKLKVKFLGFVSNPIDYLRQSKYIFVSRYLGILESLIEKKLIFAVAENQIKHDYLSLAPFSPWIVIEKDPLALAKKISYFANRPEKSKKMIDLGFAWAKQQTWDKITNQYLALWGKSKFR